MAYRFNTKTIGYYRDHFTYLDGDLDKVTNPDQSVDVGQHPPEQRLSRVCGRPIDPTYLPTRLRPKGRRKKMGDLYHDLIGTLCSEKVKRIVEEFEPGVHAFYPVTFVWKNGEEDHGHYVWIVQNAIKALHPDLVEPPYPGPNERWAGDNPRKCPVHKMVFSKERIGDAHIWSEPQFRYARFMTDALAQAFIDAEVSGFAPDMPVEVA